MKGKVWLTAVLLACAGTHANTANAAVGSGVPWASGFTGERAGATVTIPKPGESSFELTAITFPAVGNSANVQSVSAVNVPIAVSGEAGAPATGNFILDSFRAVPSAAAAWWFGSALLGLTIVARRRDGKRPSED